MLTNLGKPGTGRICTSCELYQNAYVGAAIGFWDEDGSLRNATIVKTVGRTEVIQWEQMEVRYNIENNICSDVPGWRQEDASIQRTRNPV